jgi:hypothetical protein
LSRTATQRVRWHERLTIEAPSAHSRLFGFEHGDGQTPTGVFIIDRGRRDRQDQRRPSYLTRSPSVASLFVWFGCALVRPSRCDLRCHRHARSRCGDRRPAAARADHRVGSAKGRLPRMWSVAAGHGGRVRILHDTPCFDLIRDQAGCLHARLLDAVVGRSGSVYKAWLRRLVTILEDPREFVLTTAT